MGCGESKQTQAVQNKVDINSLITPRGTAGLTTNQKLQEVPPTNTAAPLIEKKQEGAEAVVVAVASTPTQKTETAPAVKEQELVVKAPVKETSTAESANPALQQSASRDHSSSSLQQAQVAKNDSPLLKPSSSSEQPVVVDRAERKIEKVQPAQNSAKQQLEQVVVEVAANGHAIAPSLVTNTIGQLVEPENNSEHKPVVAAPVPTPAPVQAPVHVPIAEPIVAKEEPQLPKTVVESHEITCDPKVAVSQALTPSPVQVVVSQALVEQKEEPVEETKQYSTNAVDAASEALPKTTLPMHHNEQDEEEEEDKAASNESQDKNSGGENDGEDADDANDHKQEVKLDMVPKVESLIEYQEVMESTPEDATPEDATPEDATNIDPRQQFEHTSTIESQEALVADERDAFANQEIMDVPVIEEDYNSLAQRASISFEHGQRKELFSNAIPANEPEMIKSGHESPDDPSLAASTSTIDQKQNVLPTTMAQLEISDVQEELRKNSLEQVILSNEHDERAMLDLDYYLRLVNQSVRIAETFLEDYLSEAISRRRAAYQQDDWAAYETIVKEMQAKKENKSADVQEKICLALGITEAQFNETGNALLQSDRCDELTVAQQGQLVDMQLKDVDNVIDMQLSEDQTLEIFELMLRSKLEEQTLLQKSLAENLSDEELSTQLVSHNIKDMDKIYFKYNIEFKQFNAAVKHYADTSSNFVAQLIEKEEEIMDCSI